MNMHGTNDKQTTHESNPHAQGSTTREKIYSKSQTKDSHTDTIQDIQHEQDPYGTASSRKFIKSPTIESTRKNKRHVMTTQVSIELERHITKYKNIIIVKLPEE